MNTKKEIQKIENKKIQLSGRLKAELFPKQFHYFSLAWIIYVFTLLIFMYGVYFVYTLTQLKAKDSNVVKIKVDKSYIKKLNNLKDFGVPADPNEPGFGRSNPFEGI